MKGTNIGELEELVLLVVLNLGDEAYGLAIRDFINENCGRKVSISTVHATLHRLEEKGLLSSSYKHQGQENRGGRPKLVFTVTKSGGVTLETVKNLRNSLWNGIPQLALDKIR